MKRLATETLGNQLGKIAAAHGLPPTPTMAALLLFQGSRPRRTLDAKQPGKLGVVPHLGVHVQRQVVGKQVDVVGQEGLETTLLHAGDLGRLAAQK